MKPALLMPALRQGANGSKESIRALQPYLVFLLDSEPYACPVDGIHRLLRLEDAQVLPSADEAPSWEAGRLRLREQDASGIPIVCLRSLWGLPPLARKADGVRRALLVVNVHGQQYALRVDACLSVISNLPPESNRFLLPAALKGTRGAAFRSATPWRDSLLVFLEVNKLMAAATSEPHHSLAGSLQCL